MKKYQGLMIRAALAAGVGGVLLLFSACGPDKAAESVKMAPLVSAVEAREAAPAQKIVLSGQVKARQESPVGFRVAGKIARRSVDAGQAVKKGEVLFALDNADYLLKVSAMKAQEEAAKARADNAAQELERHKRMLEKELVSQAQYDRVQSGFEQAQGAYLAAKSARENAENDASYANLTADADGIVSEVLADAGQVVGAGMPVCILARVGDCEAEVYLPEKYASRVKVGDAALVRVSAVSTQWNDAVVREIAGMADPRTRTYRARLSFTGVVPRLGMSCDAAVNVPFEAPGVLVPPEAVCDGEHPHVWIVGEGDVARKKSVVIEGVQDGCFVVSGVEKTSLVIVDGARFLTSDGKVRLAPSEAGTK